MSARHADAAEWANRKALIAAHRPTLRAAIGAQREQFAQAWDRAAANLAEDTIAAAEGRA